MKQYQKLFELEGVKLSFTEDALAAIAQKAFDRKSGARGLRAIIENAMLDIMYHVPFLDGIIECTITDKVIDEGADPLLTFSEEKKSA